MVIDVFTQSYIFFTQIADTNFKVVSAADVLQLDDELRINIALGEASNLFVLTDHAQVVGTISVEAASVLTLSQSAHHRVLDVTASSFLIIAQLAVNEDKWPLVSNTLTLTDEATCEVATGAYDVLVMTDEATFTIARLVQASSGLALVSTGRAYKPDKMFIADPDLTVNAP